MQKNTSEAAKRNYELEELIYGQAQKMKPAKENLLKATDEEKSKGFLIDVQKFEPKIEILEEDEDVGGIRDKAKAVSSIIHILLLGCSMTL